MKDNTKQNNPGRINQTPLELLESDAVLSTGYIENYCVEVRDLSFLDHSNVLRNSSFDDKNVQKRHRQLQNQEIEVMIKHRQERTNLETSHQQRRREIEESYQRQMEECTKERARQMKRLLEEQRAEMKRFQLRKANHEYSRICFELAWRLHQKSSEKQQLGNGGAGGCGRHHLQQEESDGYITLWQREDPLLFHWARWAQGQSNNSNHAKNGLNACLKDYGLVCVECKVAEFYPFVRFRLMKLTGTD